jgi:cytochrome c oxidase subunit 2
MAAMGHWGLPHGISEVGAHTDALLLRATASLGLVATLLWSLRKKPVAAAPPTTRSLRLTLGAALLLFLGIDGQLAVEAFQGADETFWRFSLKDAAPDVLRVEVDARQWAWDFRYAGPDGAFNTADDVTQLETLVVPQGRPVLLELAASDVVHSFSLPHLRIKADVIPGSVRSLWFKADEVGKFEIVCAQFCGTGHYKMRGFLEVLSAEDFRAWQAHAESISLRSDDPEDHESRWGWPWRAL